MAAAVAISAVTLIRRTQEELHYDLKRTLLNLLRGRRRKVTRHTIFSNLNISVAKGEKIGVIGPNGSGKSTLLKLIAGVLQPTRGSVRTQGSIAPLIELGAGFDPELTLVDNIIYYAVLLGYRESIVREHVDSILEFAELSAIRDQPTKTLSSGMGARLAFAIATEFRPDILLLDEVLAVGDEHFRRKCSARIDRFWDAHSTIVLVSHDLAFIARTCDRVVWLDGGTVRFDGPSLIGTEKYLDTVPEANAFQNGEELIALAESNERREIVVRGTSPTEQGMKVFLIRDGRRHWVTSQQWYDKTGYSWENIIHVDDAVILEIPEGEVLH